MNERPLKRLRGGERAELRVAELQSRSEEAQKRQLYVIEDTVKRKEKIQSLNLEPGSKLLVRTPGGVREVRVIGFDETGRKFDRPSGRHSKEVYVSTETGYVWVRGLDPIHKDNPTLCDPLTMEKVTE